MTGRQKTRERGAVVVTGTAVVVEIAADETGNQIGIGIAAIVATRLENDHVRVREGIGAGDRHRQDRNPIRVTAVAADGSQATRASAATRARAAIRAAAKVGVAIRVGAVAR